jgi:hypothetical protein
MEITSHGGSIMNFDLTELKRLAEAATRGAWFADGDVLSSAIDELTLHSIGRIMLPQNAAFIAASNPQYVLALIARVEKLEAALKLYLDDDNIVNTSGDLDHCLCGDCARYRFARTALEQP